MSREWSWGSGKEFGRSGMIRRFGIAVLRLGLCVDKIVWLLWQARGGLAG